MPNAIALIKRDHRAVEKDYRLYKRAKTKDQKRTIAKRIFNALDAHAKMEEQVFYPAVLAEGNKKEADMISEAMEEHREMKDMVARFRVPNQEEREGMGMRIEELIAGVLHHAKEEEKEMLPAVEKSLGKKRLLELGSLMEPLSGVVAVAK